MTTRPEILALCILLFGCCQAVAQTVTGRYSYGHEVNAVCIGEPERCYWLVDTSDEVRRQLKQQVAGEPPYTPVCVNLIAEVSAEKAPGFGRDYDGSIRVRQLLGRCDEPGAATATRLADLQHRRWVLDKIDGLTLLDYARQCGFELSTPPDPLPELDFGDQGYVSGNTGCNRFQGQAGVADNQLTLGPLASTFMACAGFAGELELLVQSVFASSPSITRRDGWLILHSQENVLEFRPRDWVQ